MMKKLFIYKIDTFDKKLITAAIEAGTSAILSPDEYLKDIKKLAVINVISKKGDIKLGKDIDIVRIESKNDEEKVIKYKGKIPIIIENKNWTIIPLENLLSKTSNIIQSVKNSEEAKLALETMEKGANGVCLESNDINEIKKTGKLFHENFNKKIKLVEAEIIEIRQTTLGFRCCIDTSSILKPGEGLLVGDSSSGLFLVYNENVKSPYCDPRPFRVNAGGVHAYVLCPGDKTKYLGELNSGDEVLIVDEKGNTNTVIVGRNKIEKRPMLLIKAKYKGTELSIILQNAETIRLTSSMGKPISVTKLKKGDKVLVYLEKTARHFGVRIEETINEK